MILALSASPAFAQSSPFSADFSGRVAMGLIGGNDTLESYTDPFFGVEARAEFSFEIGDSVTVGIILPLEFDSEDGFSQPQNRSLATE